MPPNNLNMDNSSSSTVVLHNDQSFITSTLMSVTTSLIMTATTTFIPTTTTSIITSTTSSSSVPTPTPTSQFTYILTSFIKDSVLPYLSKRLDEGLSSTAMNQLFKFTSHEAFVQRVVAIASSCGSIAAVLVAMYFLFAIDPKRIVFRHQLIFFLLFFDLLKACILLLYPARVLSHDSSYYNQNFCQVVGFFTATAIEGADFAIFAFAIHTYLLIFKPSLNTKVKNSERVEGGLYKYRFYVYTISFFVPLIIASLAFILSPGYDSLVCWCYLPMRPVWKRLVLSWVPRYCIVVAIFVIYGLIYFHVISEFKSLSGVFNNFGIGAGRRTNNLNNVNSHQHSACNETPTFFSSLRYFFSSIKNSLFPDMHVDDNNFGPTSSRHSQHSEIYDRPDNDSDSSDDDSDDLAEALEDESIDYQNPDSTKENGSHAFHNAEELQQANFESFKRRQRIIQKQMKSIFIYPFAYCFVWLFPFILQATQFNYEIHHHSVYWLNVLGAFMQPFNGFVDACVFFYRERPWKNTAMKNFEKEHRQRVDNIIVNNLQRRKYSEGGESACSMANTSARIAKNSLSASSGLVDLNTYKPWRHWLNNLRLPFYQLPTQKNIAKFQDKYIGRKLSNSQKVLEQAEHRTQNDLSIPTNIANKYRQGSDDSSPTINATVDKFNQTHDFSDILNDDSDLANYRTKDVPDFKPNFGKFSFGKSNSNFLPNRKASTTLGMSRNRSSDAHDPNSIAGRRSSSFAGGNGNSTVSTPHRVVNSPSSSTFTPINDKSIDKDELSPSENIDEEEGELDFMEFLKKGPPV